MYLRLRKVVRYQKLQQITTLINALVSLCILLGESVVTSLISGGATILNDIEICGLVESFLGITQDVNGGFGTEHMVDRFYVRSN